MPTSPPPPLPLKCKMIHSLMAVEILIILNLKDNVLLTVLGAYTHELVRQTCVMTIKLSFPRYSCDREGAIEAKLFDHRRVLLD